MHLTNNLVDYRQQPQSACLLQPVFTENQAADIKMFSLSRQHNSSCLVI